MNYKLCDPRWIVEWHLSEGRIERRCSLYDGEAELDPIKEDDLEKIHEILPDLMNAVKTALEAWRCEALLKKSSWPEMLLYAERRSLAI
jgi:hypothetical protein